MKACRICQQEKPPEDFRGDRNSCRRCDVEATKRTQANRAKDWHAAKDAGLLGTLTRCCPHCKRIKPLAEFSPSNYRCKACARLNVRKCLRGFGRFRYAMYTAKYKGFPFTLSRDEYEFLVSLICRYCGGPLPVIGMALDQKIPDLGYTMQNVVPCCDDCNKAKAGVFSFKGMRIIGKAIAKAKAIPGGVLDQPKRNYGKRLPDD